jgi:hypothetical protein
LRQTTHRRTAALLPLLALAACGLAAAGGAAAQGRPAAEGPRAARGPLAEVRGRRRVMLLTSRALVVDARDPALVALEDYRRALAGSPPRQHNAAARQIAARVNKHIRKYATLTAAADARDADLVLVFKVTAQRPSAIASQPFVWGKMFAVAVSADGGPRVVWESRGDEEQAETAADDFLKAFRAARGER